MTIWWASRVAQLVKNLPAMQRNWVWSLGWKDPWRRERLPTPVFWPGEFHGLCSPWGCKESDVTKRLSLSLFTLYAAAANSLQLCPTLCDPIDGSPPGSPFPGTLQARTLEWVAISFSNSWKWKVKVKSLSHAQPSVTPWTAAYQAPPSMGFSRQEYWSGVLFI